MVVGRQGCKGDGRGICFKRTQRGVEQAEGEGMLVVFSLMRKGLDMRPHMHISGRAVQVSTE